jgi:hypothetical protein
MEPELEQQLYRASKEQLVQVLQELATRHPVLLAEMKKILEDLSITNDDVDEEEVTEDWDFSGDDGESQVVLHPVTQAPLPLVDSEEYRQRLAEHSAHLSQDEEPELLAEHLADVLEEAELRAEHHDYRGALQLYSLILDERLRERNPGLVPMLDEALRVASPTLEVLLSEASSSAMLDAEGNTPSPLFATSERHSWLERFFTLWLKHLDAHQVEEDIPRILLNVAWTEDVLLLRTLVQGILQQQPPSEHTNIVDFTRQYRTRALEKFLKELPRP